MLYTIISRTSEEYLIRRIFKEEIEKVLQRIVTCINDGLTDLESIIREKVRRNLTPLTREKPAPSPYITERTDESSWRPRLRPRPGNRPTQQDSGWKTDLWRTSDNLPICFHCGRPGHVTRYCRDRRRVFRAARHSRQLDQYEHWDSDSVSDYGRDPESNYQQYRSNSPYPRCNPQRHQSRSASRRSPVRTTQVAPELQRRRRTSVCCVCLAVTAKRNRRSTTSDLYRQLSSATGTTVSRQTVYRRLRHIGLYARRHVRCVPLTATHCSQELAWRREHALWTPQLWSCVMFSYESRFSLQSDSRRTLIWRAPGTRYHQENTIE
ncbi:CCHC-type domain-containing protein [Trichonephila clavipes]|nr:CCHC-type domain-containing protein [Trichonephila clavipes]